MMIHSQHGTHGVVLGESPAGRCYGDYGVVSVMWWVRKKYGHASVSWEKRYRRVCEF